MASQEPTTSEFESMKQALIDHAKQYESIDFIRQELKTALKAKTITADERDKLLTFYRSELKAAWQDYLDDGDEENPPFELIGKMPPAYLLANIDSFDEDEKALSKTKQRYLDKLWALHKDSIKKEEDKEAFINEFVWAFEKKEDENETVEKASILAQLLSSLGMGFMIVIGTVFSFKLLGGKGHVFYGYLTGSLLAAGSFVETGIEFSKDLYGADKGAQYVRFLLGRFAIAALMLVLIAGIIVEEASAALVSTGTFGMGAIGTFVIMGFSIISGISYCLSNLSLYRTLKKSIDGTQKDAFIDKVLKSKGFKATNIAINVLSCLMGAVVIGLMMSSFIAPPGLGLAIGLLIGVATLIQYHMLTLEKLNVIPDKNTFTGQIYHFLNEHPKFAKGFKITVTLLAAAGLFFVPYIALPSLAASVSLQISTLTSTIIGGLIGGFSFIAALCPEYIDMTKNLKEAKEAHMVRDRISQEIKPKSKTQQQLGRSQALSTSQDFTLPAPIKERSEQSLTKKSRSKQVDQESIGIAAKTCFFSSRPQKGRPPSGANIEGKQRRYNY